MMLATATLAELCYRIRADPDQFSQISFRTKALKVLLKELEAAAEEIAPDDAAVEDDGEGTQEVGPSCIWCDC
jgi:hypothetical protein